MKELIMLRKIASLNKPALLIVLLCMLSTGLICPLQAADADAVILKRGKLLFIQCRACHDLKMSPEQEQKVGPNLSGMMGKAAGTAEGFVYSQAFKEAKFSWNVAVLDRWLEKPSAVVPGNSMAFSGITAPLDRAALISYIDEQSSISPSK